jgi:hypothetical protein
MLICGPAWFGPGVRPGRKRVAKRVASGSVVVVVALTADHPEIRRERPATEKGLKTTIVNVSGLDSLLLRRFGTVKNQSPGAGQDVPPGSTVTLVV